MPFLGDSQNGSLINVYKLDVVLVVGFIVVGFQRYAPGPKSVISWNQLFRYQGIVDARPYLVGQEIGYGFVGPGIGRISLKFPCQIPKPRLAYSSSQN